MIIDLLRMLQMEIMFCLFLCIFVALLAAALKRYLFNGTLADDVSARKLTDKIRNAIIAIACLFLLIRAAYMASVNETPRSTIDRSGVEEQVEKTEKRLDQ